MRINSQKKFISGIILLGFSCLLYFFDVSLKEQTLSIDVIKQSVSSLDSFSTIKYSYGGYPAPYSMPIWDSYELEIKYPSTIKFGESGIVEIILSSDGFFSEHAKKESSGKFILDSTMSIILSGASFSINPDYKIIKNKGSEFPLVWSWSIAPKSLGKQELLIDLSDLKLTKYGDNFQGGYALYVTINGERKNRNIAISNLRTKALPIKVLSFLGISKLHVELLKYTFAILGFILMYPPIMSFIKKKIDKLS